MAKSYMQLQESEGHLLAAASRLYSAYLTSEERVNGHPKSLSLYVPEGDLNTAYGRHLYDSAPYVEMVIKSLPMFFDLHWVLARNHCSEFVYHR